MGDLAVVALTFDHDHGMPLRLHQNSVVGRIQSLFLRRGMRGPQQALELVRAISGRNGVTVVTDDFTIADYVDRSAPSLDVITLGGSLRKGHRYTAGPLALRTLEMLHPDKAFVTPTSYVPGRGLMTNNQDMAELKRAFLACAERTFVLMDASKVSAPGLLWFGTLASAEAVIMDADPGDLVAADAAELGCRVIY